MPGITRLAAFALLGLTAGACTRVPRGVVEASPPLAVPVPPPRVIAAVELPPPELPATPATPATPSRPPVRPAIPEAEARPPEPPRPPEPKTPEAAKPPDPKAEAAPRELRPLPAAADSNERQVREVLSRAARDLSRVNYQRLSAEGRAQFMQSKRFSDQATTAIRDRNLVFALTLAEKAAQLASGLLGR